jgi:hypothetical protein
MTGSLTGSSPLSVMTIQSLFDIGFNIDATKADAFTIPAVGRRLRQERDAAEGEVWETAWKGAFVYDLFPMPKDLQLGEGEWEIGYQGAVIDSLLEEPVQVDGAAVAGGIIGGFIAVAAAAMVVVRARKQSSDKQLTSANPMFDAKHVSNDQTLANYGGGAQGPYMGGQQPGYYPNNQQQQAGYNPNNSYQ